MESVYGDQLAMFPELMQYREVFTMEPKPGGGFMPRQKYADVNCYFTRNIGGQAASPDGAFEEYDRAQLFCAETLSKGLIKAGMYIEEDGDLFKFTMSNTYNTEGGFSVYQLSYVAGPTDLQVTDTRVGERIGNDY